MADEPDWSDAEIALEKFAAYSMDPDNPGSGGKSRAFEALGFQVRDPEARLNAARDVIEQLRASVPPEPPPALERLTEYGARYRTHHPVKGPNGRAGTLVVVWQAAPGATTPRLVTNFLKAHKEHQS